MLRQNTQRHRTEWQRAERRGWASRPQSLWRAAQTSPCVGVRMAEPRRERATRTFCGSSRTLTATTPGSHAPRRRVSLTHIAPPQHLLIRPLPRSAQRFRRNPRSRTIGCQCSHDTCTFTLSHITHTHTHMHTHITHTHMHTHAHTHMHTHTCTHTCTHTHIKCGESVQKEEEACCEAAGECT
jgi:hypothetical protein